MVGCWPGAGWMLVGRWLAAAWLLIGCWLVAGWMLVGLLVACWLFAGWLEGIDSYVIMKDVSRGGLNLGGAQSKAQISSHAEQQIWVARHRILDQAGRQTGSWLVAGWLRDGCWLAVGWLWLVAGWLPWLVAGWLRGGCWLASGSLQGRDSYAIM